MTSLDALSIQDSQYRLFSKYVQGTLSITAEKPYLYCLLCLAHDAWPALCATQHFINTSENALWITDSRAVIIIVVPGPFL